MRRTALRVLLSGVVCLCVGSVSSRGASAQEGVVTPGGGPWRTFVKIAGDRARTAVSARGDGSTLLRPLHHTPQPGRYLLRRQ